MISQTAAVLAAVFLAGISPVKGEWNPLSPETPPVRPARSAPASHQRRDGANCKDKETPSPALHAAAGHGGGHKKTAKPKAQATPNAAQTPAPPPNILQAHNKKPPKKKAHGNEQAAVNEEVDPEADATPKAKSDADEPDNADPAAVAQGLAQMLEGKDKDVLKQRPPGYVGDLSTKAQAGDAAAKCWYAAWLLSESNDKDAVQQAQTLLDQSADANCEEAKVVRSILTDGTALGTFSEPGNRAALERDGDGDLICYVGKAFLTERNIMAKDAGQSREVAVGILNLANELGSPAAKLQLALMYADGLGVPVNPERAFKFASAAAEMQPPGDVPGESAAVKAFKSESRKATNAQAEEQLGIFYMTGTGMTADPQEARKHLEAAREYTEGQ